MGRRGPAAGATLDRVQAPVARESPHPEELIQRVQAGVDAIIASLEGMAPEALYREPAPGEWSAMQTFAHVAEFVPFWARRAVDMAAGRRDDQLIGRGPEEYAQRDSAVQAHAHDTPEAMLARLRQVQRDVVPALRGIPPEGWARTGQHAREGDLTVAQVVDWLLLRHLEEHARQAQHAQAAADAAT